MTTRADYSQNFGQLPGPCTECGKKGLSQQTCPEGDIVHVVKSCRYCRAQWIDGVRSLPLRSAAAGDVVANGVAASAIEHADALGWLATREPGAATAVIYDPPYAVGTPVRGREDGAAGSVFGPFGFLHQTLSLCARALRAGGIVVIFADWRRMADMGYIASTADLRPAACVAWVRNRPGTGGLFRASWDPILIAARGVPDAVDRAAIRNVVETDDVVAADYPAKRLHPYEKPAAVYEHILARACRPGDLVLDPFAGSGSSRDAAGKLGLRWMGADIDPAYAEVTS